MQQEAKEREEYPETVHLALAWFELTTLAVIGTDCIGSCKSNYYTITMAPVTLGGCSKALINVIT
jgi:hypothetical protein